MTTNSKNEPRSEGIEQIQDLASETKVQHPEQVKGGFNPQPDPPGARRLDASIIGVLRG